MEEVIDARICQFYGSPTRWWQFGGNQRRNSFSRISWRVKRMDTSQNGQRNLAPDGALILIGKNHQRNPQKQLTMHLYCDEDGQKNPRAKPHKVIKE